MAGGWRNICIPPPDMVSDHSSLARAAPPSSDCDGGSGGTGALGRLDRSDEAVPLYRRGIAVLSRILGPRHPEVVAAEGNLALTLYRLGDHADAEALQWDILAGLRERPGGDSTAVATTLQNLAVNEFEVLLILTAEDRQLEIENRLLEHLGIAFEAEEP